MDSFSLNTVMLVIVAHFVCDFILQSDKMAVNKSTSWFWLTMHVKVYSVGMMLFSVLIFGYHNLMMAWGWVWANAALHWATDACTSRVTSYLWKKEQRHWFFVMIGFDQVIHYACLFSTLTLLSP